MLVVVADVAAVVVVVVVAGAVVVLLVVELLVVVEREVVVVVDAAVVVAELEAGDGAKVPNAQELVGIKVVDVTPPTTLVCVDVEGVQVVADVAAPHMAS